MMFPLRPNMLGVFALGLLLAMCTPVTADDSEFEMQTQRVVVFKDGYCLVVKQGKVHTDEEGLAFTDDVPDAAVLGSFWALPDKGTIRSMTAGWVEQEEEVEKELDCTQTIEIVEANLGKECSFWLDGQTEVRGKLLRVLGEPQPQPIDASSLVNLNIARFSSVRPVALRETAIVRTVSANFVIRTSDGDMMVPANSVRRLVIEDMTTKLTRKVKSKTKQKRLTFQFDESNADVAVTYMYFRPGVRWIPTYRVNLTDRKAPDVGESTADRIAEINLQGEILNEAEDLIDTPVDVVVGVPNFRFKSIPSPMVLEATLQNLLVQAAPQIMGRQFTNAGMNSVSNALYTQRIGEVRSARATGGEMMDVDLPEELSGQGTNDLFVYSLPKMTLKKGERATVPILSTEAPYRDIYTWDIILQHAESYAASAAATTSPLVLAENKVWRQVELVNNSKLPWTTGAAMFVDGFQPLAQELLTYTSPGGICRVPVTVAVDLRGKAEDREVDRELRALKWRGSDYALVKGQISAELANNKDVPVAVEVSLRFGGKTTEVSDNGEIRLEAFRQQDWAGGRGDAINNSSRVIWKSTVEPGECFEPTADYEFFIRY